MYGQIHCIVRELIQEKFGEETWQAILRQSGLDVYKHFLVFTRYPDVLTNQLFASVSEILELPADKVLQVFGAFFLTYCLRHGYDKMLKTLGSNIVTFIQNLDSLHALLAVSYKGIEAPSFRCEDIEAGRFMLHYYSPRPGLYPIVIGLVESVARELFNQNVTLTVVKQSEDHVAAKKLQHYTAFQVELEDSATDDAVVIRTSSALSADVAFRSSSAAQSLLSTTGKNFILKSEEFCNAFPYHMVLDTKMHISQCGSNVQRLTQIPITDNMPLHHIAEIVHPVMEQTIDNVFKFINAIFLLAIYKEPAKKSQPFILRGQMLWMKDSHLMMYIASPRLTSLNEMLEMGVFLSDIPLYDCTRELVLLNQQRIAEIDVAKKLDETTTALQKTSAALATEKKNTEDLLHEMLPRKVADQLTQGIAVKAEKFECVTILFSDIVTFTNIAAACSPMEIVNMLNDLYFRFDTHTSTHGVYKVETIGDAYMGVAGVPEVQEDHAERIADFAMDMIEEAGNVCSPATGLPLQIRIGLHSGPVVAGVVGQKMPRYCLFGDTVNTASRMESHSVPGRIHLSEITYSKLYDYGYEFKRRGETEVKGKGKMHTFFLVGKLKRALQQPPDDFVQLASDVCPKPIIRPPRIVAPDTNTERRNFTFFRKSSTNTAVGVHEEGASCSQHLSPCPYYAPASAVCCQSREITDQQPRPFSHFCVVV